MWGYWLGMLEATVQLVLLFLQDGEACKAFQASERRGGVAEVAEKA